MPTDRISACTEPGPPEYGGRVNLELHSLSSDADPAAVRKWWEAVRLGFHQGRGNDDSFNRFLADSKVDATTMWQVPDPDDPQGLPVGTLVGFDKSINAGHADLPARLISDVTVRPTHRRRGLLRRMITADLTDARERGLPVAALTVTEATIYSRFGFGVTTTGQRIEVESAERFGFQPGVEPTGRVRLVAPGDGIHAINAVFTQFHAQTRGSVQWPQFYQDWMSGAYDHEADGPDKKTWCALHVTADDQVDGFALYRIGERGDGPRPVEVSMLIATNPAAHLGLWQYLASIDLTEIVKYHNAPLDDPLPWAMRDRRGYKVVGLGDRVWTRILDPIRCLSARPWRADGSIVVGIDDPMDLAGGRFRITTTAGTAEVSATDEPAAVTIPIDVLAGLWLGGAKVPQIAATGRLGGTPEAIEELSELMDLATPPYGVTFF